MLTQKILNSESAGWFYIGPTLCILWPQYFYLITEAPNPDSLYCLTQPVLSDRCNLSDEQNSFQSTNFRNTVLKVAAYQQFISDCSFSFSIAFSLLYIPKLSIFFWFSFFSMMIPFNSIEYEQGNFLFFFFCQNLIWK